MLKNLCFIKKLQQYAYNKNVKSNNPMLGNKY